MNKHFTKEFFTAALIRAIRTMAQTALSFLVVGMTLTDVDWVTVVSTAVLAGVISVLTSVATGLPEAGTDDLVGDLTVVEEVEGEKPQLLLQLDSEAAIETIKKKNIVRLNTSNIKL